MKTLIVATDFSDQAENAVEYAGAAAKDLNVKVVLFNSFNIPTHVSNSRLPASVIKELMDNSHSILGKRALKLSETYSIEVGYESSLMSFDEELEGLIAKYDADMIIMGMAAKSLGQDLFGNTTTSVITKMKYPVLAIPLGATYKGIKKILFACDVLRGVHKKILAKIKEMALILGAEVEIFYVNEKLRALEAESIALSSTNSFDEALEGVPHYFKNVESGLVIEEIGKEIRNINADLLIMVPNKYGFWNALIHRSKTRIMASNNEVPLLSIPL